MAWFDIFKKKQLPSETVYSDNLSTVISSDEGNGLSIGTDGKLKSTGASGDFISKDVGVTYTTNAIKTVTAAEYTAIITKDPNTLYFII